MRAFVSILLICFSVSIVRAQDKSATLQFSAGLSVPVSPDAFTDYWNPGYNLGGGFAYYFTPMFSIQTYFDYNSFSLDDDSILEDAGLEYSNVIVSGGNISIINISANIQYNIISVERKVSPYIFAGLGYYHLASKDLLMSDSYDSITLDGDSEDAFLINFGVGMQVNIVDNFSLFGDLRYLVGFTEDDNTIHLPIRVGGMIWL